MVCSRDVISRLGLARHESSGVPAGAVETAVPPHPTVLSVGMSKMKRRWLTITGSKPYAGVCLNV